MTYLKQTRLHTEEQDGNCWSTCIACILGLDEIPDLNIREPFWFDRTQKFCNENGFYIMEISLDAKDVFLPEGILVIAGGKSPRQPKLKKDSDYEYINHVIIGKIYKENLENNQHRLGVEFIHDPHPDNTFIETLESIAILWPVSHNLQLSKIISEEMRLKQK